MIWVFRIIKQTIIWFFVCVPLMLIGMLLLPFVLPFIPKEQEFLPTWCKWFDNYSGAKEDGLSGDMPYRKARKAAGHTWLFWERYYWLALRNPINYFSYSKLGHIIQWNPTILKWNQKLKGKTAVGVGDIGPHLGQGLLLAELLDSKGLVWEVYWIKAYNLFGFKRCIRFRAGHKMGLSHWLHPAKHLQWVLTINPFQKYTGNDK